MILVAQSTYDSVEVALSDGAQLFYLHSVDKKIASALLIPTISTIFNDAKFSFDHCICAVINCGPGPFTTLRTVIATMNGLSFATKIPLIGVNALDALLYSYDPTMTKTVIALLNAYGGDLYFAIRSYKNITADQGIGTIERIPIEQLAGQVHIIGNATVEQKNRLAQRIGIERTIVSDSSMYADIATVAQLGYARWQQSTSNIYHLSPFYFKV
jgi:tRNA threonylcarbamoyladenosine biosynthesis protein TsaB